MKHGFILVALFLVACEKEVAPVLSPAEQLAFDVAAIDNYLDQKNITTAVKDPSGLRYVVHLMGSGTLAGIDDRLKVHYEMRLFPNDAVFGESVNPPPYLPALSQLIEGWRIAFMQLPLGTKVTLYIPSGLAYGPNQFSTIPPNANLIFDVDYFDLYQPAAFVYDSQNNAYSQVLALDRYCWLATNLRTAKYRNGEDIDPSSWSNYGPDDIFGKLYSFSAATDIRSVCPEGFRLPTLEEMESLSDLDLQQITLGGMRDATGVYSGLTEQGVFWSSESVAGTNDAIAYVYSGDTGQFTTSTLSKDAQASVWCVKEE